MTCRAHRVRRSGAPAFGGAALIIWGTREYYSLTAALTTKKSGRPTQRSDLTAFLNLVGGNARVRKEETTIGRVGRESRRVPSGKFNDVFAGFDANLKDQLSEDRLRSFFMQVTNASGHFDHVIWGVKNRDLDIVDVLLPTIGRKSNSPCGCDSA